MRTILRDVFHGRTKSLEELDLNDISIKRIYSILNESLLYSSYNQNGIRIKTNLETSLLIDNSNVYPQEKGINWQIINGKLFFSGHKSKYDDHHDLLIEYEYKEKTLY